jgi:hypothetical protein
MFPETRYAWRRMKLLLAELLVVSTAKGDHSYGYIDRLTEATEAIRGYRETYYPAPRGTQGE